MKNDKIINIANLRGIVIVFTILLFCIFFTPLAGAQIVTSNANISVSVTNGMSAMLIDNSINTVNSVNYNNSMELLVCSIPGRTVLVSYGTTFGHRISSLKDKNNTDFTNQGNEQSLCSAGNRGETEGNIIYDNNETGKLSVNLTGISESLKNQSPDNNSKNFIININY
jgi:hypothetical protein